MIYYTGDIHGQKHDIISSRLERAYRGAIPAVREEI